MIISVSAVSAAEDIADSADVLAQDDSTTLEADDAVDVQTNPEPAAEPVANFTTLQTEISNAGNNLTLEKDYTRVADDKKEIEIDKNFTIDGQGKYTLDGNKMGRFFVVKEGSTLTLKGVTLCNGVTQDINNGVSNHGGAIFVSQGANLVVENVAFINNTAITNPTTNNYGQGGAIFSKGNVTIKEGSKFINNTANTGGALLVAIGDANIEATFTGNNATVNGSAVYIRDTGKANIKNSKFSDNGGDAEYAIYNNGTLALENNTISDKIYSSTEIIKPGSNVTITPIADVTYGNPVVVYFKVENSTAYSTVEVFKKSGELTTPYTGAVCVINNENVTVTNLTAGQYVINIVNNEDNNFAGSFDSAVFNVTRAIPDLDIKAYVNEYGLIIINVTINEDVTEDIYFNIDNGTGIIAEVYKGFAICEAQDAYGKGTHNVTVRYPGDENYMEVSINTTVELSKETPVITNINATVDEIGAIVIKANITKDVSGNVTFLFNNTDTGKNLTVPIEIGENGTIEYDELTPFEKGFYVVVIDYAGDDKYYGAHEVIYVNVNKTAPTIDVYASSIENNVTVKVTATNDTVSGKVNITLFDKDGKTVKNITKDMVNGVVEEVTFTGIEIGDYLVRADFLGSDDFYQTFAVNETKVRASTEMNVTTTVNQFGQIVVVANLTKGATGTVLFIITNSSGDNIVNLTAVIDNGTAQDWTTDVLAKGFYSVKAVYSGDDYYATTPAMGNSVEIAKEYLNVTSKVSIMDGANQATIVFTFSGNASGNATAFFLNYGTNATYAIQNGTVVIDEIFDNGDQSILLTYDGDDKYYGFYDVYAYFFVKTSSFISAKDVNVVYQNNGKVTVTLYDNNDGKGKNPIVNAEVVITLNGKTYKATTNSKGIATVTIAAKLVPKKYTATVSYAGTNITVGDKETFKFTVKKATPKLTAKKKTFKAKTKVKKYTIVLKDNKNKAMKKVKVYLKVKGKTYTAKTNSKGKATFKIKNLKKKGTYKAKVTFKATKYFNKVTKTAKIKVKR